MTDQPTTPAASDPDEIHCALPTFMTCGCSHLTGCQHPAPAPACGEECAESHTYTGRCTQADPLPISTCPRTDRHGYHMWPDRPGPAFCPGHPAPATVCRSGQHPDHPAETCPDVETTDEATAPTAPDNPATSSDAPTCGYVKPHLPHQYLRMEVLGECPGIEAADEPCDGCNHPLHVANRCSTVTYGERCVCDEGPPAASGDDQLRDRYAAAIWERQNPGRHWADCEYRWRADAEADADAVLAVRDRRMKQLTAGRATWKTKAEEIERDRDRLLAESPWLRASDEDRQTAETALAMQKGISADLRVESRARGEKLAKAEATVTRVIELAEQWATAGAPPLGTSISRWWDRRLAELRATITQPALDGPADATPPAEEHAYLSTGCLHGEHGYCQSNTGSNGAKVPATCKFCAAPCRCECHQQPSPVKEN